MHGQQTSLPTCVIGPYDVLSRQLMPNPYLEPVSRLDCSTGQNGRQGLSKVLPDIQRQDVPETFDSQLACMLSGRCHSWGTPRSKEAK